jgi:hypothetical protein
VVFAISVGVSLEVVVFVGRLSAEDVASGFCAEDSVMEAGLRSDLLQDIKNRQRPKQTSETDRYIDITSLVKDIKKPFVGRARSLSAKMYFRPEAFARTETSVKMPPFVVPYQT